MNCLSLIGITVSLLTFIYIKTNGEREIKRYEKMDSLDALQKGYKDIEKLFLENYPYSTNLYNEIYDLENVNHKIRIKTDNSHREAFVNKHICSIMIQTIEDVLICESKRQIADDTNLMSGWISTWKQWFKSPTLRREWQSKRAMYTRPTCQFIDRYLMNQ